jgi:protein phosphatase
MKVNVPFHSLVLISNEKLKHNFPTHEFLDIEQIKKIFLGNRECNPDSLQNEILSIIESKLRLGDRVVMVIHDQSQKEFYAKFCEENGVKIFVGDADYQPIRIPDAKQFPGITVIGDVHGDVVHMRSSVQWALSRSNLICFLGDIIDYGKNSIETMQIAYSLIMEGKAVLLMGNHERKILKWANNKKVKLSDGNMMTVNALNKLSDVERNKWICKFKALCAHSRIIYEVDDFIFTHGAVHPSYWTNTPHKNIESYALYGESDSHLGFKMMYNWVNYIPKDKTVIVGHDTRSTLAPLTMNSGTGGSAIFLDTGSGKGGKLTTADLRFDAGKLKLLNYNKHS